MRTTERQHLRDKVAALGERYGASRSSLLPILQDLQAELGYISPFAMQEVANLLGISATQVFGVVSFYSFLTTEPRGKFVIRLCQTIACDMAGKDKVARQLENELGISFGQTTADGSFSLEYTNCIGMCDQGPALLVNDQVYTRVTPARVFEIVSKCRRELNSGSAQSEGDTPTSTKSGGPVVFSDIEPNAGLKAALEMEPKEVIDTIREASLRGRGGAGFPTAVKWEAAAGAEGEERYIICNADEGEPGTFKDRALLFEQASQVFDGMTIAAYAVGARRGIVYLRGEYAYLLHRLNQELDARKKEGLLGVDILGKEGFHFDIEVRLGSGAYVCGEEMSLIESLEGGRGEPRNRPPYPVTHGYKNQPTVVNNVETLVAAAHILAKGAHWFKTVGTRQSTGSKLFSVSGDCESPGLYEFPFGITIEELLQEVGAPDAKAVQVGGASGTLVPRGQFQRTLAFEGVPTGGSIIVFGPDQDMLDVAEDFLAFFAEESCGQCTPCRKGTAKLLEGVRLMHEGRCSMERLQQLESLGRSMQVAAKCGLGQTSPNIFLHVIESFKDEILGRVPVAADERS